MTGSTLVLLSLAVLIRVFSSSYANVLQKQLTGRGYGAILVNFYSYALLAIVAIPLFIVYFSSIKSAYFWIFSIAGGMAGAVGNSFLVKALETGNLSVLGPINAYKSVVGLLLGIVLLQELPGSWGLLGIGLIITGSYIVLDSPEEPVSIKIFRKKEIQYRLLALLLTGIEAVFIKRVIQESNAMLAFGSWAVFGALFSWLLVKKYQRLPGKQWDQPAVVQLVVLIACIAAMQLTTLYTLQYLPVGYALALFQLSILVSVFFGYRFFKEAHLQRKLVGAAIMVLGSVLIVLEK
ncbi:DMT family transporter [Flavihumibacter sp. CACIAM 22H1]|uniref:DMT family transporter n=1 Tax=Flavihumibacter sp. CACIAM 22H1 TaxID=1812911 RepID=UPI0007A85D5D|nr:DMT family transporter [Flavihumibacter sp. CACIAM 22H1]KYP14754.1 MAG: hypothetical protein A1D16_05590 [Flavihumibacter sp. CACIAM 22H1]